MRRPNTNALGRAVIVAAVTFPFAGISPAQEPAPPGASRDEVARQIAPLIANPPCDGLLVFGVEPDSQSAKAAIVPGDVLTIYDAQPVTTLFQLQQFAAAAGKAQRKRLPVVFQRVGKDIENEFDFAPMGLRLTPIKKVHRAVLWRDPTPYEPDFRPVDRDVAAGHRYELLTIDTKQPTAVGFKAIGFAHTYMVASVDGIVLRVQSRLKADNLDEKRDVTVGFRKGAFLPIQSILLQSKDAVVMQARANTTGEMVGTRVGVPVAAALPSDAVSSYLSGLVACTMPQKTGACLRCSYLDAFSLVAAPYADLFCVGPETLTNSKGGRKQIKTHRYEQTVFGEVVAQYWVDDNRQLIQTQYVHGVRGTLTTKEAIAAEFPDFATEFGPIERLPEFREAVVPRAQ